MRRLAAAFYLLACLAAGGCLNIEPTYTLRPDLGGTVALTMAFDMDPFVHMMANMVHAGAGGTGEPPADVVARAREELLERFKENPLDAESADRALRGSLPKGVTLVDSSLKRDGLNMVYGLTIAFDTLMSLNNLSIDTPNSAVPVPMDTAAPRPFEGLTVTEENGTILITESRQNPFADGPGAAGPPADAATRAMLEPLFKGFRLKTLFNAPFEVLEHNATRRDGTTLVWEYDDATVEKMMAGGPVPTLRIRYKK